MQRNSRVVSFHNEEVLGSERGIVSSYNFRSCVARETRGLSGEGQTTVPASNTMIQFLSCDVLRMDPDQMTWYFSSNEAHRDLRPSCGREDAAGPFRGSTLVHGRMMAPIACGEKPLGIGRLWVAITNGGSIV